MTSPDDQRRAHLAKVARERRARKAAERAAALAVQPCKACGRPLRGGGRTTRVYCSTYCRQRAHRQRRITPATPP